MPSGTPSLLDGKDADAKMLCKRENRSYHASPVTSWRTAVRERDAENVERIVGMGLAICRRVGRGWRTFEADKCSASISRAGRYW